MAQTSSRSETSIAPARCPGCSTMGNLVPILYGFHSAEAEERARRGKAVLGNYSGGPAAPRWECLVCGARLR